MHKQAASLRDVPNQGELLIVKRNIFALRIKCVTHV